MPLLKRKAFEKSSGLEFLRDDEEVFHCEITGEIFKDYEEYCERIILVNSMVWSCEMTGKPNLTYAEALESEKNARLSLRDFPMELRIPILYLASKTRRCTFAEMLDDVFNFVRDRYFVGETVEACLEGDAWSEGHVLSVTAPKQAPEVFVSTPGSPSKSSSLFSYEVEQFDTEEDGDGQGQVGIVSHDRVRRTRGIFTRDKNKLFLKQFVEQGPGGVIRIKEDAIVKYNINKAKFDQIFTGAAPIFPSSKKFDKFTVNNMNKSKLTNGQKKPSPDKKSHQQSMDKFVSKVDKFNGIKPAKGSEINKLHKLDHKSGKVQKNKPADEKSLKEEMKRVGEEMKQKKIEEKLIKKERSLKLAAYVKEWNKQKDDLELEDHKPLPQMISIQLPGIPNKYFGNFMAILEFMEVFAKVIWLKDTFHSGVDLEMLRRALTVKEVAGPLSDICQMLLSALFHLQEDEAEEYNEDGNLQNANDMKDNPDVDMNVVQGVQLATAASKWPQTYLATPLSKLPMDSQTFSEVLRLHLLSSGCNGGEHCVKWRYQQRGGYSSYSDPGLMLRIKKPQIIRALSKKHLTQLPLSYKLKILDCLINQILSYATIRDIVEERIEKYKNLKTEIRNLQGAERKLEAELLMARQKLKKDAMVKKEEEKLTGEEAVAVDQETVTNLELLLKDNDSKKAEYEKRFKTRRNEYFALQSYLGSDRAHRRYWLFESVPGLFIEHDQRLNSICMDKLVIPNPSLATAPPEDTLNYVQKLFESEHGGNSDKENDSENSITKKTYSDGNKSPKKVVPDQNALFQELLMCTANAQTCPVHTSALIKSRWSFLHTSEHIDSLIDPLNKRGVREADLRQTLEIEKEDIVKYIAKCPVSSLNPIHAPPVARPEVQTRLNRKYVDANLRFPPGTDTSEVLEMTVRDTVLDLEEKLFLGCLGELKVKDRQTWRDTILKRGYDKQCSSLLWGPTKSLTDDLHIINGKAKPEISISAYRDPGSHLGPTILDTNDDNTDTEQDTEDGSTDHISAVKAMASALLQLGQAVLHKYLKRPLGYDEKERKNSQATTDFEALRRWEISLMECTSYAQIILHLIILENSIIWSKSVLNANCRLCRKKTDAENMLLCDSCNKGHHMYCLKPKLTKVPEGDWFCDLCKPKEKTPQKRVLRKVFKEEDSGNEMDDTNTSWSGSNVTNVCGTCGSGGVLVQCTVCSEGWHLECLSKLPAKRTSFTCDTCSKPNKQNRDSESSEELQMKSAKAKNKRMSKEASPAIDVHNNSAKRSRRSLPITNGFNNPAMESTVRRCAADAINNAHHYAKMVKQSSYKRSDSESSDEPLSALQPKKMLRVSKEMLALSNTNGSSKRKSRNNDDAASKRISTPTNGLLNGFARRSRKSEAFHRGPIEDLLESVLRHKDCWPFSAPVTEDEVPDYFAIIKEPMDFGTIKTKVTAGKYLVDAQFMSDADLVFNNCFTYNQDDDLVAKAGIRLKKFFEKRCKELNLPCFPSDDNAL